MKINTHLLKLELHDTLSPDRLASACQLSIVVPVFNEDTVLPLFHACLSQVLAVWGGTHEILYIDDGSTDHSSWKTCA